MPQQSAPNNESADNTGQAKSFLRRRSDYLKTYQGQFVRKEILVLYARVNRMKVHRLGVTAPKTIGGAVIRNRFKRWAKEFYRHADFSHIPKTLDLNVLIGNKRKKKEDFKDVKFKDFEKQLSEALQTLLKNIK